MTGTPANGNRRHSLDTVLLHFGKMAWTIGNAVEGVKILGGIGSGKTSGSGKTLAEKYLLAGMGGLVLTAKASERALWEKYCADTGRSADLIVLGPDDPLRFNFLKYEAEQDDSGMTQNILQVLKTVIRAREEKAQGKNDDPFWETSLDMLICNVIDLCKLAYGTVSVQRMYDLVQALPKEQQSVSMDESQDIFQQTVARARVKVRQKKKAWVQKKGISFIERLQRLQEKNRPKYDAILAKNVPETRLLEMLESFFFDTYRFLGEKTKSIVDFSFSGFLFRLLRDPVFTLFCNKTTPGFSPEICLQGKIILLDLPVKIYQDVGRDMQIMFKYIWQRAMEKRKIMPDSPVVFLWADEAQNFIHEHDTDYQATAREARIATVYISQNLHNYYANMGGAKAEYRVKSFFGTLATKIFHANADVETNKYASELIGERIYEYLSPTETLAREFSQSSTTNQKYDKALRPEAFLHFRTGGKRNDGVVEAVIVLQGAPRDSGSHYEIVRFHQKRN